LTGTGGSLTAGLPGCEILSARIEGRAAQRIDEPNKNWKFSLADVEERKFWRRYMSAYEECLSATSAREAPWHVVPADDKENARLIVSQIILDTLNRMALYLARYLNVPPASLPGESGEGLDDLPAEAKEIRAALLDTFDRQQQIGAAARLVARHLTLGHSPDALIATLAQALLHEDAGFHAYQMLEAGVRQFHEWGNCDQGRHILIAVSRYLAAHFPTQRALLQTADIATRLMRGGELHREAESVG
jgi:hypothetical protein